MSGGIVLRACFLSVPYPVPIQEIHHRVSYQVAVHGCRRGASDSITGRGANNHIPIELQIG